MGTLSFTQNLNDWHVRVLRTFPGITADFSSEWREARYAGTQPMVVCHDLLEAVDQLHTSTLTDCEHGALWNQVFEVAYLRPLNTLETAAWDRALTNFADYLDLKYASSEKSIVSRTNSATKSPDCLLGVLSRAQSPPPKKRSRKPENPDTPPKENKRVGRPPGCLDKEIRLPQNTMKGMTDAEKRRLTRRRAAQRLQQPTPPSEEN
ncbi:hypothetical protein ST47_g9687 [Ascochyta rabiei]|uniref:Uncharacterized protein n=1 Tax=Didymella rabiei TaxID=5454 RepID=A0A162WR92_DIDRA|nr:hypothetical protein ST47_g9687 [Ascochyta rabiei]